MSEFAPPNPNDLRIPASEMPVLGDAVINIATRPEQAADSLEWRVGQLTDQISALPDTTSAEVALNPDRPDHTMKLSELEAAGKGWKLHLNFDPDDPNSVAKITEVLGALQESAAVTAHKIGQGGGEKVGASGKEATVYVGNRDKANLVAAYLSRELGRVLRMPKGDTLIDDTELALGVMGRFEVSGYDPEFADNGGQGFPMLKSRFADLMYGGDESEKKRALTDSENRLSEKYGTYYNGLAEYEGPEKRKDKLWEHFAEVKQDAELMELFDRTSIVSSERAKELLEANGYPERSKISELDMGNWQQNLDPGFIKDGFMYLLRGDNPQQGDKGFYSTTYGYGKKNTAQIADSGLEPHEVEFVLYGQRHRMPRGHETTTASELAYLQGQVGRSSFISTTTNLETARGGTGNQATKEAREATEVYVLKIPVDSVINNPYTNHYGVTGENEYLVPDYISPDEIVARFPRKDTDGITKFLADELGFKPEDLARPKN